MALRRYAKKDNGGAYRQINSAGIAFDKIIFHLYKRTLEEPLEDLINKKMLEVTNGWQTNPLNP